MPSVYQASREQFELRMRARRAATCLALARSAVARGRIDEAVERLEEACTLDPEAAEARLLLDELRVSDEPAHAPGASAPTSGRGELAGWSHWLAAAIAISALAGLAFFWPSVAPQSGTRDSGAPGRQGVPRVRPVEEPSAVRREPGAAGLSARIVEEPVGVVGTTGAAPLGDAVAPPRGDAPGNAVSGGRQPVVVEPLPIIAAGGDRPTEALAAASPQAPPLPIAETLQAAAARGLPPAADASRSAEASTSPSILPPLERASVAAEEPKLGPPEPAPANALPAGSSGRPDVPADAALASRSSDAGVEDALHRYADAYARLDAAAARAVWPTVDQRALARAFAGLESQGLVFEHCDLSVAGEEATAACRGHARYVPKVGSREPLVERREWTFQLRKTDTGWQIVQARAR